MAQSSLEALPITSTVLVAIVWPSILWPCTIGSVHEWRAACLMHFKALPRLMSEHVAHQTWGRWGLVPTRRTDLARTRRPLQGPREVLALADPLPLRRYGDEGATECRQNVLLDEPGS